VFIPYFKDIYNDLAAKSDRKDKGINKIVFTEVSLLLGKFFDYLSVVCELTGDIRRKIL
jgi:hypothetical protein